MPLDQFSFCCPQCKGDLLASDKEYTCPKCDKQYPIVMGIPDFRVFEDHDIDLEDDYRKLKVLAQKGENLDFEGLARLYWEITPNVPEENVKRYMRHATALVGMGKAVLKEVESLSERKSRPGNDVFLDMGCGTGGYLAAASGKFKHVVGIDIAFAWLIVAKKRLEELNCDASLVCCCAEYLPFRDKTFDVAIGGDVLEHVSDQEKMLKESCRVLNRKGIMFLATPNRFSLTPETHIQLWGVGFMPRRWMNAYAMLFKGIPFEHIRSVSYFELRRLLEKVDFSQYKIILPAIPEHETKHFSAWHKFQLFIYNNIKRIPVLRLFIYVFGPFFQIICYGREENK